MGTAEGSAGLGGFRLVVPLCGRLPFGPRDVDAVLLAQPAAQVHGPAAGAAEWKLGPFRGALAFHHPVADGAAYPYHRKLTLPTSTISSRASPPPLRGPPRPCRLCRLPCLCRPAPPSRPT